jgi:hypothetical protein
MITYNRFQQGMIRVLGSALLVLGGALVWTRGKSWQEGRPGGRQVEGPVNFAGGASTPLH